MKSISQSDIDRMESMSRALQGMQGLQNVRVPQVNTGGTGSGTPNPADINTEPASSGRSTSHSGTQTEDVSNTGGADNGMSHADSQLQEVTRSAGMARTALSGVKKVIGEIGGLTGISYVGQQIGSLPHKIGQALGSLRTMYSEFKKSGGILGAFGRTIKAVATNLGSKLAAGMKQVTSSLGNAFTSKVHNATSALGSFLSSIKRIALYRMIRFAMSQLTQCFKDGINNLYNYSALMGGTFANSMNSLATNAQYLKNSMGAMAAPLINALAPAIDFVIGKVVALFNILNQLFARLTGSKTYTAAKKVAATYGGAAKDAAGTASKAAKKAADEIKRYTLGFDELNILGDKNKDSSGSGGGGGGGGGASTPDYGSMFEELPIDNSISEFADKLKEAFEAGDWKELGTILGNKFNEIVDSIDWAGFGKKVGYGINGAVQTAYWFLKTADFKNLGNHVAEFLNSALSEIDFTFVGRLLVRGFTAGLDFLRGALGGLNWKLVGKSFGDFLRGAFNEMQEWIAGIDWSGAAHALWQNTKDCIAGIDFASLAQSFFKLLGTAMGAAVSFIATIVSDIWKDITGYFQKYLTNDDGTKKTGIDWVKGICKGIVEGVKSIGTWIYDNVFKPFIDGFKSAFGIHSPSTVMAEQGGYIVEGLLKGIKDGIGNVLSFIGDFLIGIKDKISDAWDKIKSTASEKWGQIKSVLSGAWENIKTTAGDIWGKISSTISGIWGGIKTKASETWSGLKTTISQKWSEIKTNTSQTWENIKTTLGNTWQNVKTTASTTWTNIKTSISTACGYFTIDEPPRALSTITISALDRMIRFDKTVDISKLSFPMTVADLLDKICTICGVTMATDITRLPNKDYQITAYPEGQDLTYRTLLQWCAALTGTCAFMNYDGNLELKWYEQTDLTISPSERYNSDMQENDVAITGIYFKDAANTEYIAGTDDYCLDLSSNGLLQDNVQVVLDTLYVSLKGFWECSKEVNTMIFHMRLWSVRNIETWLWKRRTREWYF